MSDNRKSWTIEQDQAILSIVSSVGTKNWPLVSQQMKEKFQLNNRSGKQCRQRWHNHLSPDLKKQSWSECQQQQLFQSHRKYGNRWIQISKQFGGRTDNSIKNHFYSTIRRSMRRVCKILGNKNSTSKLRNIKPSVLSEIFQFSKTQSPKSIQSTTQIDIASSLLQYGKQKPKKSIEFDPSSKQDLQILVTRLIQLNDQYINFKKEKHVIKMDAKISNKRVKVTGVQRKMRRQQLSQTNPQISEGEHSEKEQKSQLSQSNTIEKPIDQNELPQILEDDQNLEQASIEEQIQMNCMDDYLIVKSIPINSMFESTHDFGEKEHQLFHFLEKPSFNQINILNHSDRNQQ